MNRRCQTPSLLRRASASLALSASCLTLVACGNSNDSGSDSGTNSSTNDQDAAQVRLRDCLRDNGVDIGDQAAGATPDLRGIDQNKLNAALEGPCKDLQKGAFGTAQGPGGGETSDRLQSFSSCMRKEGVDIPDIASDGGIPEAPAGIDMNDPEVQTAIKTCQGELPQGGIPGGDGP